MPGNALKLEPWDTNGDKDEGFPQVQGAGVEAWDSFGASRPNSSGCRGQLIPGVHNTVGLCGLECDDPYVSPNRSPNLRQRMVLSNRDKESLLEEIIDLKRALSDQAYHLRLHKVHYSAVQLENRKLEKDIEDLEVSGNLEAPRTGGPTRLRAKLQGLRTRMGDLQATCDLQHDELCQLRRDIRVAHTRECEVERDVYAAEIGRLQKVLKCLKALQVRITAENQELSRLRDKSVRLKLANQRVQSCIVISQKMLERANKEVTMFRAKASECSETSKDYASRVQELQLKAELLEKILEKERAERQKVERKLKELAHKRKEWDKAWEEKLKKKALGKEAYRAQQAAKAAALAAKKKKAKSIRKDKGAHATAYGNTSSSSEDDGKPPKKTKREILEAKKETSQKYETKKKDLMKMVQDASKTFIQQEHAHYDKVFAGLGSPPSAANISQKDLQKQHELETRVLHSVDDASLDFIDHVEDIHYGHTKPKPDVEGLSPRQTADALAKHEKDEADAFEKRKVMRGRGGKGSPDGSRPDSPSSSSDQRGGNGDSRPGTPSSQGSASSGTFGSSSSSSSSDSDGVDSANEKALAFRKDKEKGQNGRKMSAKEFEEQRGSFLRKVREASQIFIEKEQTHYGSILGEIENGTRHAGSKGWFTTSSIITTDDKQFEQAFQSALHDNLESAADRLLDHVEDAQYGDKVARPRDRDLKSQEDAAKRARERDEKMHAQKDMEEKARKKVEQEMNQRWKSGDHKVDVMIDNAKLEEDEYAADVKEVRGRLRVEINLKRTSDHPYPGSPKATTMEDESRREEIERQVREAEVGREARRMESMLAARERENEVNRWEAEKMQISQEMKDHRGLTAAEDWRRQELEAKLAAGIPLTSEEEAELKALHARMRGRSGLTFQEELRFKELQAKLNAEISLTEEEQREYDALKGRFRGKSGLTSAEEDRLRELQQKVADGIPLSEEEAELKALKAKVRGPSGLTSSERSRLKELQAKLNSGIPLSAEEEAELRDLKLDVLGKSGLTGREEARMHELEAKLQDGIPLTALEEAELRDLKSRFRGKSGLTAGQESQLQELEEKLRSGIPLMAEEEEELRNLQGQMIGNAGLTKREEDRLRELEAKVLNGIPLIEAEEAELKRLQRKLKAHSQLTQSEDDRRRELEAMLAQGLTLTEEEETELRELQAKRWNEWPLGMDEEQRRKELEAKVRSSITLTTEEEAELLALQQKLKGRWPMTEFGEVDMSRSDEMKKEEKLPFIDVEMQGFIKENIRGVLGHLENITEVIVQKQQKLAKHEAGAIATVEAAFDVLKASDLESGGSSKPGTPRGHGRGSHDSKPGTPRGHKGGGTPSGSKPGTPRGEKHHVEKGEHSRFGHRSGDED